MAAADNLFQIEIQCLPLEIGLNGNLTADIFAPNGGKKERAGQPVKTGLSSLPHFLLFGKKCKDQSRAVSETQVSEKLPLWLSRFLKNPRLGFYAKADTRPQAE